LAKKFVCVRIQSMNGVNLNQFQYEFDLTWMSFFQDAAGRTYARYGGREDQDAESYLTKASLLRLMRQVLALHETNDVQPVSRYEPVAEGERTPEDIPTMNRMMAKRKESCIHCHDVKVAQLRHLRDQGRLRKELVFTYPSPRNLGIQLHPDAQNVIQHVAPASAADDAGLRAGDVVESVDGQRILTFADFTRVLELAPAAGMLPIVAKRAGHLERLTLSLPEGWRTSDDPSWRASVETVGPGGGFWGAPASAEERQELGIGEDDLALRVTFIWGEHTRAAGIKLGDYVVSIDGKTTNMNVRQIHTHLHLQRDWGDTVPVIVIRDGQQVELALHLPRRPPD
jgi:predicted metalloprotease with PDZ domain